MASLSRTVVALSLVLILNVTLFSQDSTEPLLRGEDAASSPDATSYSSLGEQTDVNDLIGRSFLGCDSGGDAINGNFMLRSDRFRNTSSEFGVAITGIDAVEAIVFPVMPAAEGSAPPEPGPNGDSTSRESASEATRRP